MSHVGLTGGGVPSTATALASPVTVTCRGLTKRFGGTGGVLAVNGLDLDVPAGSVFGLLGPNGAGKTTTLRLLAGLARPTSGTITIDDRAVTPDDAMRRGVGVLDQDPRYYAWMTGRELVELAGKLQGLAPAEARSGATETLRRVGLADAAQRRVGAYSGGMRQRLGIAQALVAAPRLLILDEPVSSLDPAGRRDLLELIVELRASATVIFSTHVLGDVERICDRVGIMDRGRLAIEGPLDDLLARYALPLYRIEADPGQAAGMATLAARLRGTPWVDHITEQGGGRLLVSVTDEDAASDGLLPLVVAAGVRLTAFERVRPTLEDVFLRLVGGTAVGETVA
jgi:ABC-2 type transport system ATP-binding protein